MNIASRFLPPLLVIAAFAVPAVLLRPAPHAKLQHTICLDLPASRHSMIELARTDIEGCFLEWQERYPGDAELRVHVRVNDGTGSAETVDGPGSPMLWLCVSESLARVAFPRGLYTDADVVARWTSGALALSMTVMPESRERAVEIARDKLVKLRLRKAELEREIEYRRRQLRARRH